MKNYIYIASKDHSGSTLLDIILGSNKDFIGLGELFYTFKKYKMNVHGLKAHFCSCGKSGANCNFWGPVIHDWETNNVEEYKDALAITVEHFNKKFPNQNLVDSSKYSQPLAITATYVSKIKVIHLIKDVRSYYVSKEKIIVKRGLDKPKFHNWKVLYNWNRFNENLENRIQELNLQSIQISYENLCFDLESTLTQLGNFLKEDLVYQVGNKLENHILHGNPIKTNVAPEINYDIRWLKNRKWLLPYLVLPKVARNNVRWIYNSNNKEL